MYPNFLKFETEVELIDFLSQYNMTENENTKDLKLDYQYVGGSYDDINIIFVFTKRELMLLISTDNENGVIEFEENDIYELLHEKEIYYFDSLGDFGFYNPVGGFFGLSSAPCFITDLSYVEETGNGTYENTETSRCFYDELYCLVDWVSELKDFGCYVFVELT
jgi:hypothetical protein